MTIEQEKELVINKLLGNIWPLKTPLRKWYINTWNPHKNREHWDNLFESIENKNL